MINTGCASISILLAFVVTLAYPSDMPTNKLNEPTKPYQTRYNSTPVLPSYGELTVCGEPVRVKRGKYWVPAVPVEDPAGNKYYVLKCHLGKSRGTGISTKGARTAADIGGYSHLFKSVAMYKAWIKRHREMIRRCTNPKCNVYHNYGAKGVVVYEAWRDRKTFFEYVSTLPGWDDPSKQLDRKDNAKGYVPGNVRFSTRTENVRNRSNTVFVDIGAARLPLAEVADELWPWYPKGYVNLHWRRGRTIEEINKIALRFKNRRRTSWS